MLSHYPWFGYKISIHCKSFPPHIPLILLQSVCLHFKECNDPLIISLSYKILSCTQKRFFSFTKIGQRNQVIAYNKNHIEMFSKVESMSTCFVSEWVDFLRSNIEVKSPWSPCSFFRLYASLTLRDAAWLSMRLFLVKETDFQSQGFPLY